MMKQYFSTVQIAKNIKNNISRQLFLILFLTSPFMYSQISGNQVYGSHTNSNNGKNGRQTIRLTNNTMTINASILMNVTPDEYKITLGVNQEGKTIKECNNLINTRIQKFINDIKKIGVTEGDTYIDFISSTKIYDFNIVNEKITQIEKGFEIKKNIIIRLKDIKRINKIIESGAEQKIYDIIKVDYIKGDTEDVYEQMYQEALSIIKKRKNRFPKLKGTVSSVSDNFYSVFPKSQYQTYQAFETSSVSTGYSRNYIEKLERKNKTYYYEGMDTSTFDKVINGSQTDIGIQYVFTIEVVYSFEKEKVSLF